jgi:hypothetical protein
LNEAIVSENKDLWIRLGYGSGYDETILIVKDERLYLQPENVLLHTNGRIKSRKGAADLLGMKPSQK